MRCAACGSSADFCVDWANTGTPASANAPASTITLISLLRLPDFQTSTFPDFQVSKSSCRFAATPFLEQPRGVAGDGMQCRRPAERARPRTADDLVECQRVGVGSHLLPRLGERH